MQNLSTLANVYATESNKVKLSRTQFVEILKAGKFYFDEKEIKLGHTFASMLYFTNENKASKKTPLNKRTFTTIAIGTEYSTKVMNQATRENENAEIEIEIKKSNYEKINVYLGLYPKDNEYCLLYNFTENSNTKTEYFDALTNEFVEREKAINEYFTPANRKPKAKPTKEIIVNGQTTEQTNKFNWQAIKIKNIEAIKIKNIVFEFIG